MAHGEQVMGGDNEKGAVRLTSAVARGTLPIQCRMAC